MQVLCLRTQVIFFSLLEEIQRTPNSTVHCVTNFHTKQEQTPEIMWSPNISQKCLIINVISVTCLSIPRATWPCTGLGSTEQIKNHLMKVTMRMCSTCLSRNLITQISDLNFNHKKMSKTSRRSCKQTQGRHHACEKLVKIFCTALENI